MCGFIVVGFYQLRLALQTSSKYGYKRINNLHTSPLPLKHYLKTIQKREPQVAQIRI